MSRNFLTTDEAKLVNDLMPGNQLVALGDKMKYVLDIANGPGTIYFLDPTRGSDGNDGLSRDSAFQTLPFAYSKLADGKGDTLVYIAGTSSITLTAQLVWSKSYTSFIGLCAPTMVGQRARIFQGASATGISPLISISGSSNIFQNLYIFQGINDATSLINVQVGGGRNYFKNVHFAGVGNATMDAAGACSLKIRSGSENTFEDCVIGQNTATLGANSVGLLFDSQATRNYFKGCLFDAHINAAGHAHVKLSDNISIDRWQIFENCLFITDSVNRATAQTSVFTIPAGTVQGKIILKNSYAVTDGAPDWDSGNRVTIWNNSVAAAASAAGGACTIQ
jgi:hypothetical protein